MLKRLTVYVIIIFLSGMFLNTSVASVLAETVSPSGSQGIEQDIETDLGDNTITRLAFSKLAVEFYEYFAAAHGITNETKASTNPYVDTNDPYAIRAYDLGIINGIGDGKFNPDDNITIEEKVTILYRTFLIFHPNEKPEVSNEIAEVSSWAQEAFNYIAQNNITVLKSHDEEANQDDFQQLRGELIKQHEAENSAKQDNGGVAGANQDQSLKQQFSTPLTPNSNAVCNGSGDAVDDSNIAFYYHNQISYWSTTVSANSTSITLQKDVGNAIVTFKKGLTVQYTPYSNIYIITVDGVIVDCGSTYNLTGKSLGVYPKKS